jgi:short-subunit dehydrogenase
LISNRWKYNFLERLLFLDVNLNINSVHKNLKGKTVLISGATFGIGEALCELLAQKDLNLILIGRTESKLVAIKTRLEQKGCRVTYFAIDLRVESETQKVINHIESLETGLDYFVNNAGKSIHRSLYKSLDRFHDFKRTMSINYFASVQLCLGVIPFLEKSKGGIINVSALNVLLPPMPGWSAYQASKTAFDQWVESNRLELEVNNINISTLYLPLVKTRMIAPNEAYDNYPAMKPGHVAEIIAKLMCKPKRNYKPWWLFALVFISRLLIRPTRFFTKKKLKPNV